MIFRISDLAVTGLFAMSFLAPENIVWTQRKEELLT